MTDRPIIFRAPMIRALLAGSKSMTRRLDVDRWKDFPTGGKLWVRETFWHGEYDFTPDQYKGDPPEPALFYRATDAHRRVHQWSSSIYMPRWASRITLTVMDVKFERVNAITPQDAIAEGVTFDRLHGDDNSGLHPCDEIRALQAFDELWNSIHGLRASVDYRWVAAISFTVGLHNIDAPIDNPASPAILPERYAEKG